MFEFLTEIFNISRVAENRLTRGECSNPWHAQRMSYIPYDNRFIQVDLQTFLSLTDADLKELGITTFGPRRKMLLAIQGKNFGRRKLTKRLLTVTFCIYYSVFYPMACAKI